MNRTSGWSPKAKVEDGLKCAIDYFQRVLDESGEIIPTGPGAYILCPFVLLNFSKPLCVLNALDDPLTNWRVLGRYALCFSTHYFVFRSREVT